jgi:hypothetical protein
MPPLLLKVWRLLRRLQRLAEAEVAVVRLLALALLLEAVEADQVAVAWEILYM